MKWLVLTGAVLALGAVQAGSPIRQVPFDTKAKTYVFDGRVADDVRFCVKMEPDQRLACVSAKDIRTAYRGKRER